MTRSDVNLNALEAAHEAFRDPANRGFSLDAAIQAYLLAATPCCKGLAPERECHCALAASAPEQAVNGLAWEQDGGGNWFANTPFGQRYYIYPNQEGQFAVSFGGFVQIVANIEVAKAAAQTDFEQRIIASLASPASISGGDTEAVAGLCPRCAGTGRDPSTTALQCCKCMGSGAVVLRAALTTALTGLPANLPEHQIRESENEGRAPVPLPRTRERVQYTLLEEERFLHVADSGPVFNLKIVDGRCSACGVSIAALATAPEGKGGAK